MMSMSGDLIKEYLVGLGFEVDQKGLNNFNKALDTAKKSAMGIIGVAAAATTGIMKFLGDMNEKEKKLEQDAKKMRMKNIEDARAYNIALEAMGVTAQQLRKDKTLRNLHKELTEVGKSMALPDSLKGLENVKKMMEALTRLKVTASYIKVWLNAQIQKIAGKQIDFFTNTIDRFNGFLQKNIKKITEWAAIGAKVILSFATTIIRLGEIVLDVLSRIPGPVLAIASAIAGLWALIRAGPTGWITAAIMAIMLLLDDLFTYLDGGDALLGGFWAACIKWIDKIKEAFMKLKKPIENVKQWFVELYNKIKENVDFGRAWENIKGIFSALGDILATIVGHITSIVGGISGFATANDTIKGIGEFLQDSIVAALQTIEISIETIRGFLDTLVLLLQGDLKGAWEKVKQTGVNAFNRIKEALKPLVDGIKNLLQPALNAVNGFFDKARDASGKINFAKLGQNILEGIKAPFEEFAGSASSFIKKLIMGEDGENASWGEVGAKIWSGIKSGFTAVSDFLKKLILGDNYSDTSTWKDAGEAIWNAIQSGFTAVSDFLKKLILGDNYTDTSTWKDAGEAIWNAIKSGFTAVGGFLKNLILGDEASEESSWSDVGTKILQWIKNGYQAVGGWLKSLILGDEASESSSWSDVGAKILGWIKDGYSTVSDWLKGLILGDEVGESASWGDVGAKILSWIKDGYTAVSGWLKGLILGDEAGESSSWSDVGNKILGWIEDGVTDAGDFLKKLVLGEEGESANWSEVGQTIWNGITTGFTGVSDWLKGLFTGGDTDTTWMEIGSDILSKITGAFGNVSAEDLKTGLSDFASKIGQGIANAFEWTTEMASTLIGKIQSGFSGLSSGEGTGTLSFVADAANAIIRPILDKITEEGFISGLLETAGNVLEMIINGILSSTVSKIEGAEKITSQIMNAVLTSDFVGDVLSTAGEIFRKIVGAIVSAAEGAGEIGASLISAIFNLIAGASTDGLGESLVSVASTILDGIVEGFKSGIDVAGKIIGAIADGFGKLNDAEIGEEIGGTLSGIAESLLTAITNGLENANFSGLMQKLGEGIRGGMEFLGDIAGSIVGWILSPAGLETIANAGLQIIIALSKGISMGLYSLGEGIFNFIGSIVKSLATTIAGWFGLETNFIVENVAKMTFAAVDAQGNAIVDEAGNVIKKTGGQLKEMILAEQGTIAEQAQAYLALVDAGMGDSLSGYEKKFTSAGVGIAQMLTEGIKDGIDESDAQMMAYLINNFLDAGFKDNIDLYNAGIEYIGQMEAGMKDGSMSLPEFAASLGIDITKPLAETIDAGFSAVTDAAEEGKQAADGALKELEASMEKLSEDQQIEKDIDLKTNINVEEPDKLILDEQPTVEVKSEFSIDAKAAEQAVEETKEAFTTELETLPDEMEPIGQEAGEKLAEGFESSADAIIDAAKEIPNAIVEEFLLNMSESQGVEIASAFGTALIQGMQETYNKIQEVWRPFPEWLRKIFEDAKRKAIAALQGIVTQARAIAQQVKNAFNDIPDAIGNAFDQAASAAATALDKMAANAESQANRIKDAFSNIAGSMNSAAGAGNTGSADASSNSRGATPTRNASGGVYDSPRLTTVAEDNEREYIIPIARPNNAIPLLRAAMADLGITPESFQRANTMLGGNAAMNMTPAYAQPFPSYSQGGESQYYNETNNTPVNINIYGNNPAAIGNASARAVERMWVRNRRRPV